MVEKRGINRRSFLGLCAAGMAGGGVVGASIPFIKAMGPARDTLRKGEPVLIESADLPEEGEAIYTSWRNQEVVIIHLKEEWAAQLKEVPLDKLADPIRFEERTRDGVWFVALNVCTHAMCAPRYLDPERLSGKEIKEFEEVLMRKGKVKVADLVPTGHPLLRCPCHFGVYDLAGRVLAPPPPENLWLVPYKFVDEGLMVGHSEFPGWIEKVKRIQDLPEIV